LTEIDKMIELIAEEGKSDKENLDWCNKERKENKNHSLKIIFLYSYAMHLPSDETTRYKCAKLCALSSKQE